MLTEYESVRAASFSATAEEGTLHLKLCILFAYVTSKITFCHVELEVQTSSSWTLKLNLKFEDWDRAAPASVRQSDDPMINLKRILNLSLHMSLWVVTARILIVHYTELKKPYQKAKPFKFVWPFKLGSVWGSAWVTTVSEIVWQQLSSGRLLTRSSSLSPS